MKFPIRLPLLCSLVFLCNAHLLPAAVSDVTGSAQTTILQFFGVAPIQTDFSQQIIPLTKPDFPATATAHLDRLDLDGSTTAAAQGLSQLDAPNLTGVGNPNDTGIDLSAFSEDDFTGWRLEAVVNETRTLNLSATELGATNTASPAPKVRSRILISGVMIIAAMDAAADLSGVEANLTVSVTQHRPNRDAATVLAGDIALTGNADGTVTIGRAAGIFEGVNPPLLDFNGAGTVVPLAKAVIFQGLELPYEYDVIPGEEFKLDLFIRSQVITKPGGIGAATTFGTPQGALGIVFQKAKQGDAGQQLADLISQHVDTTGAAYVNSSAPFTPVSLCGASSVEVPLLAGGLGAVSLVRSRRRLRR